MNPKKRLPRTVTPAWLKQFGPCHQRYTTFRRAFKDGIKITVANVANYLRTQQRYEDLAWILYWAVGSRAVVDWDYEDRNLFLANSGIYSMAYRKASAAAWVREWNKARV